MSKKPSSRAVGQRIELAANGPRTVRLAIVGFGTVGSGTARVLLEHQHEVARRLGCRLELKTICDVQKLHLPWLPRTVRVTPDWKHVIADPEIDVIVELIGGVTHAREVALAALHARKHLVTANKHLVAEFVARLQSMGVEVKRFYGDTDDHVYASCGQMRARASAALPDILPPS